MRRLAACAVVVLMGGCDSAEKAARRLEAARSEAARRRAETVLVKTAATNLPPAPAQLVLRVSPTGLELEDVGLEHGLIDGGVGPRTLDRFKQPGTDGWLQLPLLVKALRQLHGAGGRLAQDEVAGGKFSLDVAPETPVFRLLHVLMTLNGEDQSLRPLVTLAGPTGLVSVWIESTDLNELSETCGHDGQGPTNESCIVPRVRLGAGGAQVLARAGTERCYVGDNRLEPPEHTWNEGPFLTSDGGCVTDAPAALVREVAALGPGCLHTLVEVTEKELPWSRLGGLIGTLAADDPGRRFVLSTPSGAGLLSCVDATRPAQWVRFVRKAPAPAKRPVSSFGDAGN